MEELIYYIINFAILAGIIFIGFRKTIISIFRERRVGIEKALNELASPVEEETVVIVPTPVSTEVQPSVQEAIAVANRKIEKLKVNAELECRELSLSKLRHERKAMLDSFSQAVRDCAAADKDFRKKDAQRNELLMNRILEQITLTPGDMAYLKYHDILYVTLTSAEPLSESLQHRAQQAAEALLAPVNGKISFWVRQDPAVIGGLSLRIGDTMYDGTIEEQIYLFSRAVEKRIFTEKDSANSLLDAFLTQTEKTNGKISVYQRGRVISASDGICWMDGLADIMYGEVVEFSGGERGMVLDIQKNRIGCVILGGFEHIESYTKVRRVGRIASVPVGNGLLGRVVNAIGSPIDGKGVLHYEEKRPIEYPAPGILDRATVSRPMHTGLKAIDAMVPIGKGQRELLLGDRQTGKTAIVIDTILNQKGKDVICIYVAIGQKESTVSDLRDKLELHGAMDYTIIVSAMASDAAAMQYIAPFAGTAIGEHFMYSGKDVLIIYDDLSKHAVAYRELSLLLQRPSGREAYPGDIFYLHSRLLERSAQLAEALGGGSITALPIIETQAGDISSYIPTNVISITDGQIFLESDLFHEGQRPAVNVGLSVSRVGSAAQTKLMKQAASDLRTKLAQYRELEEFSQFGAEVDDITKKSLNTGRHLMEALKQNNYAPLDDWKQALILFAASRGHTDQVSIADMAQYENQLCIWFEAEQPELTEIMKSGKKLSRQQLELLNQALNSFTKRF